ncbi:MAG TPA: phage baseplate protein [Candidatus Kapabacteria bacterium]|jgi:hypothetical protein|nr:phage baseplate protein [Candidatus Kapabacteria bacterium]
MHALSSEGIVALWEIASATSPLERPSRMLAAALGESVDVIARLPLGRRDALLLELREATFGRRMKGFAVCVGCGERLELELDASTLRAAGEPGERTGGDGSLRWRLRPISSADVVAAASLDANAAAGALLERAVVELERDGEPVAIDELDDAMRETIASALADCDPLAEILLDLECPSCATAWSLPFDAATYLHAELATAARRLLADVHAIAGAYGWSEAEILALSPARRECYLEMIT